MRNMTDLARRNESDFPVPSKVKIKDLGGKAGFFNPLTGTVSVDDFFLGKLTCDNLVYLYETIVHESIHKSRPIDAMRRPNHHPDIAQEGVRRAQANRAAIEKHCDGVCPQP